MEQHRISLFRKEIRLDLIFKTILKNWKKYIIPLASAFVISALLALSVPRYYMVKIMLAPEYSSSSGISSALSGIGASVGLRLGGVETNDAIAPMFYPDLMQSTEFLVPLLDVEVRTKDGEFTGAYSDYLRKQKSPWWDKAKSKVVSLFKEKTPADAPDAKIDPFFLTKHQTELVEAVGNSISCSVDKKTDVITLVTVAQDPLVAALFADTVKAHLQNFIIDYRTKKARIDLAHIDSLFNNAKQTYEKSLSDYARFSDTNQDLVLKSYEVRGDYLETKSQLANSAYGVLMQQKQMAEAKVQERTPAFTTIQNATVPVRHAGPKRMLFVMVMLLLTFVGTSVYIIAKDKVITF